MMKNKKEDITRKEAIKQIRSDSKYASLIAI